MKVSFTYSPRYPVEGQAVQFADASTGGPVSWQWDFGDGVTSTEKNPVHVYTATGFRRITLVAANGTTSKRATRTLTVIPAPEPATFVFSPDDTGAGTDGSVRGHDIGESDAPGNGTSATGQRARRRIRATFSSRSGPIT